MEYMSVKKASEKFNLSERRIQKLCESNRISGSTMVSGVWLIPENATKPKDERLNNNPDSDKFLSLNELCKELSISIATGRNWIKLGKLFPKYTETQTPYFEKKDVDELLKNLQIGENKSLKSRRNKKFISGNALYNSYISEESKNKNEIVNLLSQISNDDIILDSKIISLFIADCFLKLFISKNNSYNNSEINPLLSFLENDFSIGEYDKLVFDLIEDKDFSLSFCKNNSILFSQNYIYESNEDILGLIYISCNSIGNRKATGSYYTPTKVVKKLIEKVNIKNREKILDPCCGTGNFLLQLPKHISFEYIFGNDIDSTSIKITRLNMVLKYNVSVSKIYEHITELNYLTDFKNKDFTYIIGNPPWGYEFSDNEKLELKKLFKTTSGKNIESYDVFIEQAFNHIIKNGHIVFVLPEAILNVKAHTKIRELLLQNTSIKNLIFLGNTFDGVQCPCIVMDLEYTHSYFSTKGMYVTAKDNSFTINIERNTTSDLFSFLTTDKEYSVINKVRNIKNACYLSGNADFALGIVTGNNSEYIVNRKTDTNEMILKGSDICKFHTKATNNYLVFEPEKFQQVAPTQMYRAKEKLLYRFISSQLVFAYDDKQTLSLNSCNIVIPKIPNIQIKYVLAILNSRIAQFIFRKEFNSIKILRSHIENIPIPVVDFTTQNKVITITERLITGLNLKEAEAVYDELDNQISELFNLTQTEIEIVKKAVDRENKFLS